MLTLTFLGTGAAFAKRHFQSNALVEAWKHGPETQSAPNDTLLIDFGTTGPLALHRLRAEPGFEYLDQHGRTDYRAIRNVYITHLHSDHIGGLEEFAWCRRSASTSREPNGEPGGNLRRPRLLAHRRLLADLWDHALSAGLGTTEGHALTLEDFFDVVPLSDTCPETQACRLLDRYALMPFPTDHLRLQNKYDWPSYGLYLTDTQSGLHAFYSGDTRFDPAGHLDLMRNARVCFHEVCLDASPHPVHTTLTDLAQLPDDVRKSTYLYHYGDNWDDPAFDSVSETFAGFAIPRRRYILFP